jgi:hypothetical protein
VPGSALPDLEARVRAARHRALTLRHQVLRLQPDLLTREVFGEGCGEGAGGVGGDGAAEGPNVHRPQIRVDQQHQPGGVRGIQTAGGAAAPGPQGSGTPPLWELRVALALAQSRQVGDPLAAERGSSEGARPTLLPQQLGY